LLLQSTPGIVAISAVEVILQPAVAFLRRAESFEAGGRVPLFVESLRHAEVTANQGANIPEGRAVVFQDVTGGATDGAAET
jgi:hypothetical protein